MYLFLYLCAIAAFYSAVFALLMHVLSHYLFGIVSKTKSKQVTTSGTKFGLSLLPVMAMGFGCKTFVKFDSLGMSALIAYICK